MFLSPQLAQQFEEIMTDPKGKGFDFLPLSEVFAPSPDDVIPFKELYDFYLKYTKLDPNELHLPLFAVIMEKLHGAPTPDEEGGGLGYYLKPAFELSDD
ncbi:hypothetical protein GCM10027347_52650 [Larkinella harenae]